MLRRRQDGIFDVDADDYPHLRARPTWVSAEEHIENIQNEINLYADGERKTNHLGRSNKRDIQIKLKAVSADHCSIQYTQQKGWTITEAGKTPDKASSNGTYVFLKTLKQMKDHMPSDLIPLHEGMIISFVNYELRVGFEPKTADDVREQTAAMTKFFAAQDERYDQLGLAAPQGVTAKIPLPGLAVAAGGAAAATAALAAATAAEELVEAPVPEAAPVQAE